MPQHFEAIREDSGAIGPVQDAYRHQAMALAHFQAHRDEASEGGSLSRVPAEEAHG